MVCCVNTAKSDWKEGVQLWACSSDTPPDKVSFPVCRHAQEQNVELEGKEWQSMLISHHSVSMLHITMQWSFRALSPVIETHAMPTADLAPKEDSAPKEDQDHSL